MPELTKEKRMSLSSSVDEGVLVIIRLSNLSGSFQITPVLIRNLKCNIYFYFLSVPI